MFNAVPTSLMDQRTPAQPFVLLVDDHAPSLRKLEHLLESVGYSCVSTVDSTDVLPYCRTRRPALVVTDLAMPRLDGHNLARGLKARFPELPILLLTGEVIDPPKRASWEFTFSGVFSKPIEVEPFLALIANLLPA